MKPLLDTKITTAEEGSGTVAAVFDTGSFYSFIREDKVPGAFNRFKSPKVFRGAAKETRVVATGEVYLTILIGDKEIDDSVLVSPDLAQEMLVGAGTMQKWDVSIVNRNGHTEIRVGRDMHDPLLTEVD